MSPGEGRTTETRNGQASANDAGTIWAIVVFLYLVASGVMAAGLTVAIFPEREILLPVSQTSTGASSPAGAGARPTAAPASSREMPADFALPAHVPTGERGTPADTTARDEEPRPPRAPVFTRLIFHPTTMPFGFTIAPLRPEQGLILLSLLSGVLGSFLHGVQSLTAYLGNRTLKKSWLWWYAARPPLGAILGMLFYFVVRAGLIGADADSVSAYGVVTFGGLAGWFSKQATEKLAEVFETLFNTKDREIDFKDKLRDRPSAPKIAKITPSPVVLQAGKEVELQVAGQNFKPGAALELGGDTFPAVFVSDESLTVTIPAARLPARGSRLEARVVHGGPSPAKSEPIAIQFE